MNFQDLIPKTPEEWARLGIVGSLAGLAILSALGVVVAKSPVRSALSLVLNFFTLAFLYFTLGAEMMGITQIVVYTGAIMVLFLFVIMLLNLSSDDPFENKKDLKIPLGVIVGLALFATLASQIVAPLAMVNQVSAPDRSAMQPLGWGSPQAIGRALFTGYVWPFEIISLLLMLAVVGSIILVRRKVPSA